MAATIAEIRELLAEAARYNAESARYNSESARQTAEFKAQLAEYARRDAERDADYKAAEEQRRLEREKRDADYKAAEEQRRLEREKRDAEWKRERAEIDRAMKESSAEVDRQIKAVSQQLGYIGNNNGSVAEEYFYNSFNRTKEFAHQRFDYVERNKEKSNGEYSAEFDIVMYNCQSIAIIEVKYKVHKNDIAKVLEKQEKFRKIVSSSKDKTVYLGIAGLSFPLEVETATLDAGIAVIKQVGDNLVVLDDRVKKF